MPDQDWFSKNAPQTTTPGGEDWFSKNAPDAAAASTTATTATPSGFFDRLRQLRTQTEQVLAPTQERGTGVAHRASEYFAGGFGALEQMAAHPIKSAQAMAEQAVIPLRDVPGKGLVLDPEVVARGKQEAQFRKEHPAYYAGSLTLPLVAGELLPRGLAPVGETVSRTVAPLAEVRPMVGVRRAIQETLGGGEEFQTKLANQYSKDAQSARAANQKAIEDTLRARGKIDEDNTAAITEYGKQRLAEKHAYNEKMRKAHQERADQLYSWMDESARHKADVERHLQERDAAENILGERRKAEQGHQDAWTKLRTVEREARANAKREEDAAWAPWHKKAESVTSVNDPTLVDDLRKLARDTPEVRSVLGRLPVAPEDAPAGSAYAQMRDELLAGQGYGRGSYFKLSPDRRAAVDQQLASMGMQPEEADLLSETTSGLSLEQVHKAQSILGEQINAGKYEGPVRRVMVQAQKRLVRAQVRGSMDAGAVDELQAGKAATKRYHESFGRVRRPKLTKGEERLAKADPEAYARDQEATRMEQAAKYSQEVADAHANMKQAQAHLEQFPQEDVLRARMPSQPPARPVEKPLSSVPQPPAPAEPFQPKPYGEPEPLTPTPQTPDFRQAIRDQVAMKLRRYRRISSPILRLAMGSAIHHFAHGTSYVTSIATGEAMMQVLNRVLSGPSVLDWLSRDISPDTMRAIEKLPAQDAANLKAAIAEMAQQDAQQGVAPKLSPAAQRLLGPKHVGIITSSAAMRPLAAAVPATAGEAKKRVEQVRQQVAPGSATTGAASATDELPLPPVTAAGAAALQAGGRRTTPPPEVAQRAAQAGGRAFVYRGNAYSSDREGNLYDEGGSPVDVTKMSQEDMAGLLQAVVAANRQQGSPPNPPQPVGNKAPRADAKPGPYVTQLSPQQEAQFQQWVKANRIPWRDESRADYDMRGYWQKYILTGKGAQGGVNPNDRQWHFTDEFKTPYHHSFSGESRYALPNAPHWINDHQLADSQGRIVWDERKRQGGQ